MTVAVFSQAAQTREEVLHLLIGHEDGSVALYRQDDDAKKTIEGLGWTQLWRVREHSESGGFSLPVSNKHLNRLQLWECHLQQSIGLRSPCQRTIRLSNTYSRQVD